MLPRGEEKINGTHQQAEPRAEEFDELSTFELCCFSTAAPPPPTN
jgi:hypothetical protein